MNRNLKNNYSTEQYSTQIYEKRLKVEFPILSKKDHFILYLYARYLGYKLIYDAENKKALVINGERKPGFIQKFKDRLVIKYKDGEDFIDPQMIISNLEKRLRGNFLPELIKAEEYAASCVL